jgi:uncharacterized protein (DUF1778 family)
VSVTQSAWPASGFLRLADLTPFLNPKKFCVDDRRTGDIIVIEGKGCFAWRVCGGGIMAAVPRTERLDVRMAPEVKSEIERAAALSGQTVSNFVIEATVRRARKVIREASEIRLSARDRDRFLAALDRTDAKPNAALLKAAKRHKAATR